jgi:hypothetical protein
MCSFVVLSLFIAEMTGWWASEVELLYSLSRLPWNHMGMDIRSTVGM